MFPNCMTHPLCTGADKITDPSGNNVVLGGISGDSITTSDGDDIILGDEGIIMYNDSSSRALISSITVAFCDIGGDDTIVAGEGNNLVIGGFANDIISTGSGIDLVIGDNGDMEFSSQPNFTTRLLLITTQCPDLGGMLSLNLYFQFNTELKLRQ